MGDPNFEFSVSGYCWLLAVKFYDLYTTTIATMMTPENVLKMASLDKGKAVKRPQAAYGEAFSGAAALGKQATSVFGRRI